jgi:hypothetical protein
LALALRPPPVGVSGCADRWRLALAVKPPRLGCPDALAGGGCA